MADEIAEALGLPADDDIDHSDELITGGEPDPEPEPEQETAEPAQDSPVQESSEGAGDVETAEEGSDTEETDSEPQKAAEPTEMQQLMAEMAELKKANSGLYAEMHSERERRKQLMEEYKRQAEEEKASKDKAERAASLPDKDVDPVGYMTAKQKELVGSVEQRLERMEQARQQEAQQQIFQRAVATVNADEENFRKQKSDYDDALGFVRQDRARQLRAMHPDQSDEWINGMISQGDRRFALESLQQGASPAARAYDYAVRLGYTPGSDNGGQAAPAAAPAPSPVQTAQPEKPKMTSLSAVTGKTGGGRGTKVTYEQFANLDLDRSDHREIFDKISMDPGLAQEIETTGHVYL